MSEVECSCGREIRLVPGHPRLRWVDAGEAFAEAGAIAKMTRAGDAWAVHYWFHKTMLFSLIHPLERGATYAVAIDRCGHPVTPPLSTYWRYIGQDERDKRVVDAIVKLNPEIPIAEGFESALCGVVTVEGKTIALYDREECIQALITQGLDATAAEKRVTDEGLAFAQIFRT